MTDRFRLRKSAECHQFQKFSLNWGKKHIGAVRLEPLSAIEGGFPAKLSRWYADQNSKVKKLLGKNAAKLIKTKV